MRDGNVSVFSIFGDRTSVEEAIGALCAAGFRNTDISVLFQANEGSKDLGIERNTKGPEGAVLGWCLGVLAGAVLGWLVGNGELAIPGFPTLAGLGPIAATLAAVGCLGLFGAIVGGLIGLRSPEYEVRRYNGRIKGRSILLSLHCDDLAWVKRAKETLRHAGAESIGFARERRADFSVSARPRPRLRKAAPGVPPSWPDTSAHDEADLEHTRDPFSTKP